MYFFAKLVPISLTLQDLLSRGSGTGDVTLFLNVNLTTNPSREFNPPFTQHNRLFRSQNSNEKQEFTTKITNTNFVFFLSSILYHYESALFKQVLNLLNSFDSVICCNVHRDRNLLGSNLIRLKFLNTLG